MSGLEITGVVLAAFPLAISAVEHYHDGLVPLRDYYRYNSILKSFRTHLRVQQDLFEGTMKRLLLEELSTPQAQALFPGAGQHADREQLNTPEIDKKLRNRLGDKYENFMAVVCEMKMVMGRLGKNLDIDIEEKPSWNATASTPFLPARERGRWEWRKIRRSFTRKHREALLQELDRHNGAIARYVEQREILAPLSTPRPDECSRYYHVVRDNACDVYYALEDGWRCRCSNPHNANLQLECRNPAHASPLFNISLSFMSQSSPSTTAQRKWLEAQVNVDELDDQIDTNIRRQGSNMPRSVDDSGSTDALVTSSIIADTFSPVLASNSNTARKLVRIAEPHSGASLPSKQQGPRSCIKPSRRAPQITSLCEAIRAAQSERTVDGYLAYTSRECHIKISSSSPSNVAEPVSLDYLLSAGSNLPRRQRLSIAVNLAHAVLQLHKSPWLNEFWSKKDIYFSSHGLDRYKRPVIDHLYVSRLFKAQIQPDLSATLVAEDYVNSVIINRSLFALGIILIELGLNKAFEDLYAESKGPGALAPGEPLSTIETYSVATNLVELVYDEQGTQYGYVVQRCLKCEFGILDSKKQLDIDAFLALVYEGVLAPLEDILEKYSLT